MTPRPTAVFVLRLRLRLSSPLTPTHLTTFVSSLRRLNSSSGFHQPDIQTVSQSGSQTDRQSTKSPNVELNVNYVMLRGSIAMWHLVVMPKESEMGSVESRQKVKMPAQQPQSSQSVSWCSFSVFLQEVPGDSPSGSANNLNGQRVCGELEKIIM